MMHKTMAAVAVAALLVGGCSKPPATPAAQIKDMNYAVTPASVKVKAGILSGEMTELKVSERVEDGSGRIDTPARLTGKLTLKNVSSDQSVRLLGGNVIYMDMQGKPIPLEANRAEPTLKVSSYNSQDRLDPGQEAVQAVEAEFPAAGLKAKRLKDIRVDLLYIPSAYKRETMNFGVSLGEGSAK
jgi:hypothetical protein